MRPLSVVVSPAMETVMGIVPIAQIILSAVLIGLILMQRTGAGLGSAFGSDSMSSGFHTRRGAEKTLFNATIVIAFLFAGLAFAQLFF